MKPLVLLVLLVAATAHADPVPPRGLPKVTHDTSLTGTGQTASPLGLIACVSTGQALIWNAGTSTWGCGSAGGGTVTNVDTLAPLQGGPITSTGTVSLTLCPANQLYKVNGGGTAWGCAADAGITGTITSGDLIAATGTSTVGNYAGSTPSACTVGNVTTGVSIGATGALTNTCTAIGTQGGITGGSLTTNVLPKATGATSIGNSSITDDGSTVSTTEDTGTSGMLWAGGASSNRAVYFGAGSNPTIGARYNSNSVQALLINTIGYLGGTTQNRNLFIGDGRGNNVIGVTGSTKTTEFFGPVTLDTHIGTTGTAPTLSTCGTSPTITGTDTAGLITLGTSSSGSCTVTFASTYSSTPACQITLTTAGTAAMSISARSASAFTVHSSTDTSGSTFSYFCIGNPN
jgi:hypothetical protein